MKILFSFFRFRLCLLFNTLAVFTCLALCVYLCQTSSELVQRKHRNNQTIHTFPWLKTCNKTEYYRMTIRNEWIYFHFLNDYGAAAAAAAAAEYV